MALESSSKTDRTHLLLVTLYLAGILSANALAAKLLFVGGIAVTTGALAIPLVYLTTDLLNELHGPAATRQVVWLGFIANLILVAMSQAALAVPGAPFGASQSAMLEVFAVTPRIVIASLTAYLISSFTDVWAFHRIREATGDAHFWLRKNGSTVVSQAVDSGLFVIVAFGGAMPWGSLFKMALGQYVVKMLAAPLGTPLSYLVLRLARRTEKSA